MDDLNLLISKITKDIIVVPDQLKIGEKNLINFLEEMISLGSKLDQLFSLANNENPNWEIQENLLTAYEQYKLRCVYTLLVSNFGKKLSLRTKYPKLIEADGVRGILLPLIHSEFQSPTLNSEIRFGEKYKGETMSRPSTEGVKQFKQAHTSLKIKIDTLAIILRDEVHKGKTKNKPINNNLIFSFNLSTGELSRFPKELHGSVRFTTKKGRGKVLKFLIEEKDSGDHYVSTEKLTEIGGYHAKEKCRTGIHKIRENVHNKFKNVHGDEFIESKQTDGYRIGTKITISFEDTP